MTDYTCWGFSELIERIKELETENKQLKELIEEIKHETATDN